MNTDIDYKRHMTDESLMTKYKHMLPICANPHPKSGKVCCELYATPLAWCAQCYNANKLLDILANYEALKIAALDYLETEPILGENAKLDKRTAIHYYATHEI